MEFPKSMDESVDESVERAEVRPRRSRTYCLGACLISEVVSAVALLAVALVLLTDYNGLNNVVKHQIDEV